MSSLRGLTIPSSSTLARRPSNNSAGYCRTCSSSAIQCGELYSEFKKMRANNELCDIVISVESTSFETRAHRLILSVRSPFFKQHFQDERECSKFEFPSVFSVDSVQRLLDYMYESELQVVAGNVEDLLRVAVFLQLPEVIYRCCQFMTSLFQVKNFTHHIGLANDLDLPWLLDKFFLFLEWHFIKLTEDEHFGSLASPHLYRLVSSKGLRVAREETLYQAVMKWYSFDPTERKASFENIMEKVHFEWMSPEFIENTVIPELVEGVGLCDDNVSSAQTLQRNSPTYADTWGKGRYRHMRHSIYMLSSNNAEIERYDEVTSTCLPCPELALKFLDQDKYESRCLVNVNDYLYLLSSRGLMRFNPEKFSWKHVGDGVQITDAGICAGLNSILVVGGKNSKVVKAFDVENRKWAEMPEMKTGRRGPGIVCHSNVLYVIGGFTSVTSSPLSSVDCLDLTTKVWSSLPPMRVPRYRLCCVTLDGKIFAMGGRNEVRNFVTVEIFEIENKKWTTPENHMFCARDLFCATVLENVIFCFGGRGEQSIECCDPDSGGVWTAIGQMGEKFRSGLSCVTYNPAFDWSKMEKFS